MPVAHDEFDHKNRRLQAFMEHHALEAVILTLRANYAWYTCGGCNHVPTSSALGTASILVTHDRPLCVTSNIEAARQREEELDHLGIEVVGVPWHDEQALWQTWKRLLKGRRAACDRKMAFLPDEVTLLPSSFSELRWTLTSAEMERYRILGREVASGLEAACRQVRPGISEHELGGLLVADLHARGIRTPVVLMAADERIAQYRHPLPTQKRFTRCGMAVVGGERHGLHVSATRLFSFHRPGEDLSARHRAVCAVDAAILSATEPGRSLGEIFAVAQRAYADAGYPDEWRQHHQGGPTGYQGRELKAAPGIALTIRENQAFTWNPSIAGTKSEDTLLISAGGPKIITDTDGWPTSPYQAGDLIWQRPDILVLS